MPRPVDADEVRRLVSKAATLVEVLPEEEYAEEHLPGAINIPLKRLGRDTVSRLDRARPIVVYCYDGL